MIQAMQSAALDEHHVVFSIDHSSISYLAEIMNPIEAVLEGSEIPNLFGDDLESLAKPLKSLAQQEGFQESLSAYFWTSNFNICPQSAIYILLHFMDFSQIVRNQTTSAHCSLFGE